MHIEVNNHYALNQPPLKEHLSCHCQVATRQATNGVFNETQRLSTGKTRQAAEKMVPGSEIHSQSR